MSNPNLLVVDDHPDTLRLFETFLSLAGFAVTTATGAAKALDHVATGHVDAVATDLAMPGMDGFELIRRLRSAAGQRPVPIVAITGQAINVAQVLPSDIGCCRLLLKPCDLAELGQLLHFLVVSCEHDCERCSNRIPPMPGAAGESSK
ncbi:MAG: response regulator [Bacteroidales bacterium]